MKCVGPHSINELNGYEDSEDPKFPRYPGKASDFEGLRKIIDGYDCGVSYADFIMGRIFDELKSKGLYDDVAVIVTSDHGENLGELGIYAEHGTADYATFRIPLIIKWPGVRSGVESDLHCNVDLCPTMADLLGTVKYSKWDGVSFAESLLNGTNCGRESLVVSQMAHVCQRSVRFGDFLYMRSYHDGFHLFPKEMLFNIKSDPYEETDLSQEHPEICAQGASLLMDWNDEMMASSDSRIDPLWTVMHEEPQHAKIYCVSLDYCVKDRGEVYFTSRF